MMRKATLAAGAFLALAAAGCGEDDEKSGGEAAQPARMAIELSGSGKNLEFSVPRTVKGGLVQIEFTNSAKGGERTAQFVRADKGHTGQEALQAAGAWAENGKPLPEWAHTAGGFGEVPPGETQTVTQRLPAGDYAVAEIESNASAGFKVSGAGAGGQPSAPGTIEATEYKFDTTGLKAGRNTVVFDNKGAEPHFAGAAPIKSGKTIADVREYLETEKGEDPLENRSTFTTAVIDGGGKQSLELDLKKGSYALLCFVPDRKGGPPHVVKGMVSEAQVR